ncbi:hypothetical protein PMAYCL1PPCAC_18861, partial [Pristionchus mayeri]
AARRHIRVVRLRITVRQRRSRDRLGRRHGDLLIYRRISAAVAMTRGLRLLLTTTMFTTISRRRRHTRNHTRVRREEKMNGREPLLVSSR